MSKTISLEFATSSQEETEELASKLGKYLKPGNLLLLFGDLGSGKTTFIKGLCKALEVPEDTLVVSPTFSLINIYEGRYPVFHVDLYRLSEEEVLELGLWENLEDGIIVVEWADRLTFIPNKVDPLYLFFEHLNLNKRKIKVQGSQEWLYILKELERDAQSDKQALPHAKK